MSADPSRRVLGVIRPTVERLGQLSSTGHIGIVGTPGTIASHSYEMEIEKLFPEFTAVGQACPMWVPLVENGEADGPGADYFVERDVNRLLERDGLIDTMILGCTHYPLLYDKIRRYTPQGIRLVPQGQIVADSLADYLNRHPEMESRIDRGEVVCISLPRLRRNSHRWRRCFSAPGSRPCRLRCDCMCSEPYNDGLLTGWGRGVSRCDSGDRV